MGCTEPALISDSVVYWRDLRPSIAHQKMKTIIRSRKTTISPIKFFVIFQSVSPIVMLEEEHWANITYFQFPKVACGRLHWLAGRSEFENLN